MDYKNLILRSLISLIFVLIYFLTLSVSFILVFYLIVIIYILILLEIYLYFKNYKFIPILYILISFSFFIFIDFNEQNILKFNLFIFTVISFDIFSYVSGKYFGKNKFIKISPNKTFEGLVGGVLFSLSLSLIFSYFIFMKINQELILFIIILVFTAFIGDILESFFKRKNNLKNSSFFVPGHGGVFDRFDSFLFSIIFYSIFNNILL